jgi:hypothetical protein
LEYQKQLTCKHLHLQVNNKMKKALNLLFGIIISGLFFTSCTKENDCLPEFCDQSVIVNKNEYSSAPGDQLTIISAELQGDCLKIKFASGGCNGNSWEVKLIDSEVVLYSYPPQRNLRLSLKNKELCLAHIEKEITFDVKNLQVPGNKVLLNIANSGSQILYEY